MFEYVCKCVGMSECKSMCVCVTETEREIEIEIEREREKYRYIDGEKEISKKSTGDHKNKIKYNNYKQ